MKSALKKTIVLLILCLPAVLLCACTPKTEPLENLTSSDRGEYQAIVWGDRIYVPFCAISNGARGEKIGIVDGDENDQVYEYKGYSTDEWVISFYHSGLMDSSMLMREINVLQIPEELQSDYAWNQ